MEVYVHGDEIWYDGYRVGVLVQECTGTPATVLADFEMGLNNGTLFENSKKSPDCCCDELIHPHHECPQFKAELAKPYETAVEDIMEESTKIARGGLLRLTELAKVCKTLKEETP